MKVAISVDSKDTSMLVCPRFGRSPMFAIYDTNTKEYNFIDNKQNLNAAQGAGIQSAQTVVSSGAKALITMNCGPKAFSVLGAANVDVCILSDEMSVVDAIAKYNDGKLVVSNSANVEGHW